MMALRIVALLAIGVFVAEVAIFLSHFTGSWWVIAAGAVITYGSFLSLVFLGKKDAWQTKYFKRAFKAAFASSRPAIATAVLCAITSVIGAAYLWKSWPRQEFTVAVYAKSFPHDDAQFGVDVIVQPREKDGQSIVKPTLKDGTATFPAKRGQLLNVAVRTTYGGKIMFGNWKPFKIDDVPAYERISLSEIANDSWSPATESSPQFPPVAVTNKLRNSVIVTTFDAKISEVDSKYHAPWGSPPAPVIIHRYAYSLGYDSANKIARWVAHRLQPRATDSVRPSFNFQADPDIGAEFRALNEDYVKSGYDRGRLADFSDIASLGENAVRQAFYLSIAVPRVPAMNRTTWAHLNSYARSLMKNSEPLFAIAGPVFMLSGHQSPGIVLIGPNQIPVPTHLFYILARNGRGNAIEALAFLIPNDANVDSEFGKYQVSIAAIESATDLRFFPDLAKGAKEKLASNINGPLWPSPDRPN